MRLCKQSKADKRTQAAAQLEGDNSDAGWSSSVARRAHNPKVVSSNLAPATNFLVSMVLCKQQDADKRTQAAAQLEGDNSDAGWSSSVARRAHNPKVVSSNLAPATNFLVSMRLCKQSKADKRTQATAQLEGDNSDAGWSSSVARRAHNPKVVSSNLAPATNFLVSMGLCKQSKADKRTQAAAQLEGDNSDAGWSSSVARRAHNPKVVSSNLAPATNFLVSMRLCKQSKADKRTQATAQLESDNSDAGWSSSVARRAHNPKVVSSNLAPATNFLVSMRLCKQSKADKRTQATARLEGDNSDAGWSSSVARRAHNPKVVSSNLAPATNFQIIPSLYCHSPCY